MFFAGCNFSLPANNSLNTIGTYSHVEIKEDPHTKDIQETIPKTQKNKRNVKIVLAIWLFVLLTLVVGCYLWCFFRRS